MVDAVGVVGDLDLLRQHQCCVRGTAAALSSGHADAARTLHRLLERQGIIIMRLKRHVVPFDHHVGGGCVHSTGELVLRARSLVIESQIPRLCSALGERVDSSPYSALFIREFGCVSDVANCIFGRLHRVTQSWTLHRDFHGEACDMARVPYVHGIRRATADLDELYKLPALSHFLYEGKRVSCPEVRSSCELIESALVASVYPNDGAISKAHASGCGTHHMRSAADVTCSLFDLQPTIDQGAR